MLIIENNENCKSKPFFMDLFTWYNKDILHNLLNKKKKRLGKLLKTREMSIFYGFPKEN